MFNNAADDQENIRRAIYLDGGIDTLNYLLNFDLLLNQQAEETKQTQLDAEARLTQTFGDFNPGF